MRDKIKELFQQHGDRIFHAGELLMVAVIFFGLGALFVERIVYAKPPITVQELDKGYALAVPSAVSYTAKTDEKTITASASSAASATAQKKEYVASRYGKTYYHAACDNRIKEENKIFFRTKEDAEKAGLVPAKSCAQ